MQSTALPSDLLPIADTLQPRTANGCRAIAIPTMQPFNNLIHGLRADRAGARRCLRAPWPEARWRSGRSRSIPRFHQAVAQAPGDQPAGSNTGSHAGTVTSSVTAPYARRWCWFRPDRPRGAAAHARGHQGLTTPFSSPPGSVASYAKRIHRSAAMRDERLDSARIPLCV